MDRRFLALFAATITLIVAAALAGRLAAEGGGALAVGAAVALALPAALGLAVLVRVIYLDARVSVARRRASGGWP